jgi:glycyl-tRNA synthetase
MEEKIETKGNTITIEELATYCKKKGFVYQDSEIYGGLKGFFDFGPYGSELFNNLKADWWKRFVHDKENVVGIDASIISHQKVWKASGHLDNFGDLLLTCSKCKNRLRADLFVEDKLNINVEGMKAAEINKVIQKNNLKCPECNHNFEELKSFNLLFSTKVGADDEKNAVSYLRGETAQAMFTNFKIIADTSRQKLPFGVAQIGKCFRNEIAPRDFMFRCREFTIGELEFFIHPEQFSCNMLSGIHKNLRIMFLSAETQDAGQNNLVETTIGKLIEEKRLDEWHAYWLSEQILWLYSIGLKKEHIKIREHMKNELSHYSSATFDIDYMFPFGSKEIAGNANRGQYDLGQHIKESKEKLEIFDEETKKSVVPRVIEPTFGIDRVFLALLVEGYDNDETRGNVVLRIKPSLAPIKIGVFPLVNKLNDRAYDLFKDLKGMFYCTYDKSGSIGRRYARADELGIPFCVTVDFESLEDECVTVRKRDDTSQERVKISELKQKLFEMIYC